MNALVAESHKSPIKNDQLKLVIWKVWLQTEDNNVRSYVIIFPAFNCNVEHTV